MLPRFSPRVNVVRLCYEDNHARNIIARASKKVLSYSCSWISNGTRSNYNNDVEESSKDYNWKWLWVSSQFHQWKTWVPNVIIHIPILSSSFEDIRIDNCNRIINRDADTMATNAHFWSFHVWSLYFVFIFI